MTKHTNHTKETTMTSNTTEAGGPSIRCYNGRSLAVDGPKGHVLVTPTTSAYGDEMWEVWHSDSLDTIGTARDKGAALALALRAAGITL